MAVLSAPNSLATYEELVDAPSGVRVDFVEFIQSLGWFVELECHAGFAGRLSSNCPLAPYYSDDFVEVIFNVPYLLNPPSTVSLSIHRSPRRNGLPRCNREAANRLVSRQHHVRRRRLRRRACRRSRLVHRSATRPRQCLVTLRVSILFA